MQILYIAYQKIFYIHRSDQKLHFSSMFYGNVINTTKTFFEQKYL